MKARAAQGSPSVDLRSPDVPAARRVGARHGKVGIQKYCRRQNLVVTRFGANRELYYFLYSKGMAKLTEWLIVALFGRGSKRPRG